jgi:hypothetical protein
MISSFFHATASLDYGIINWDIVNSFPDFYGVAQAMAELQNETVLTAVRPYSSGTAFQKSEHDAFHSQRNGSEVTFPHSFISHPVHSIPGDFDSEIVAYVGSGFAWDFALRYLLPEGVDGIIVEIENSCNQTFSYQIKGPDAYFIGDGSKHESKYEQMKKTQSLSIHTHPNFTTTPGHCYYSIVRQTFHLHN